MKDIEGIERALQILKPYWSEIEADFDKQNTRFLALVSADHDAIGRVLRAHLAIEAFMVTYLQNHFRLGDVQELRLSFWQKAKLLPDEGAAAAWVKPGILQVNAVRNKFGHNLAARIDRHEISAVFEVLSVARGSARFENVVDAIEAFAPVACAMLTVPPVHLQQKFREAFADVRGGIYEPPEAANG